MRAPLVALVLAPWLGGCAQVLGIREVSDDGAGGAEPSSASTGASMSANGTSATATTASSAASTGSGNFGPCMNYVFVTTAAFAPTQVASNGDKLCAAAAKTATSAMVLAKAQWVAVYSTASQNAKEHIAVIGSVAGTICLTDGTPIAAPGMWWGAHAGPINRSAKGDLQTPFDVWTGTKPDGTTDFGHDCSEWSVDSNASQGTVGNCGETQTGWIARTARPCSDTVGLYCISD